MSIRKSDAPDILFELVFGLLRSPWRQSQKSIRDEDMFTDFGKTSRGFLMLKEKFD
jgi:hypothetical protein